MNNLNFLTEILMSNEEYWTVAKKNESHGIMARRSPDYIALIVIPMGVRRGLKRDEITLVDIEDLQRSQVQNIFLNTSFTPFQTGITFRDIYRGFPITEDVRGFLLRALELGKTNEADIWKYEQLLKETEAVV